MKELIGKVKLKSSNLPRKITVNKVDLFDETKIAHEFNFFFTQFTVSHTNTSVFNI